MRAIRAMKRIFEKREFDADAAAAKDPERLKKVFDEEATGH